MSESTARIEKLIGSLWTHMDRGQNALKERLGEIDHSRVSPALFATFASTADGLLKLGEGESESMWYSFAEVVEELAKAGQMTREQCAAMSAVMDETSEAITRACEQELVEAERRNPMAAVLRGTARVLALDEALVREAVGPSLVEFISESGQLLPDE